ncbi:hypothetical protein ACFQZC_23680 [Streptacidiphilus monticola]
MSGESELREQLQALVSERPEVPSPAPMVMGQVRRSRRRRRSVGVLAIAAAVAGGVLVGVDRPAAQQGPAARGPPGSAGWSCRRGGSTPCSPASTG